MAAVRFASGSADRVAIPSVAAIDGLDPWTLMIWCLPTTVTQNQFIFGKGAATPSNRRISLIINTGGAVFTVIDRATTDLNYVSGAGVLVAGRRCFIATTFNSGNAAGSLVCHYAGTQAQPATLTTGATADGSGAYQSDSGINLNFGNHTQASPVQGFDGVEFQAALSGADLTLPQIRAWQFDYLAPIPRLLGKWRFGAHGTAVVVDESGNGNHGAIVTATQSSDLLGLPADLLRPLHAPWAVPILGV